MAIVGNATVVNLNIDTRGYAAIWASGLGRPGASNINYPANQVIANGFIAKVGEDYRVSIQPSTSTHFLLDANGYFAP